MNKGTVRISGRLREKIAKMFREHTHREMVEITGLSINALQKIANDQLVSLRTARILRAKLSP